MSLPVPASHTPRRPSHNRRDSNGVPTTSPLKTFITHALGGTSDGPASSGTKERDHGHAHGNGSANTGLHSNRGSGEIRLDFLVERARTTNLALALILLCLCFSLYGNLVWLFTPPVQAHATQPLSIRSTLQSPHSDLTHLIMVPGHAIWTGSSASTSLLDSSWILEPMQKGGAVKTFLKHITKGAELAVKDPKALLVFSGGQTRRGAEMTEAMSYARLARAGGVYDLWEREDILTKGTEAVGAVAGKQFDRVTTEDFALDSYENTLYAISRFKEFTGSYPTAITVVGYGMKRRRYVDVHRAALRWPSAAFTYIGIDNEEDKGGDYEGERRGGLEPFVRDSYGCKSVLLNKRRRRNVFRRFHGYHSSCPELAELLEYCPKDNEIYPSPLPWDP